jgi:hypothetical protein
MTTPGDSCVTADTRLGLRHRLALIAVAAGLATYFPARHATRVDPCRTLRADG